MQVFLQLNVSPFAVTDLSSDPNCECDCRDDRHDFDSWHKNPYYSPKSMLIFTQYSAFGGSVSIRAVSTRTRQSPTVVCGEAKIRCISPFAPICMSRSNFAGLAVSFATHDPTASEY